MYLSDRASRVASRGGAALAFLLYLGFVIYGSLLPFELRTLAWDQAVAGFEAIPYLDLKVVSRADWIANIVLYVPLAFLGCTALLGVGRQGPRAALGVLAVGAFCIAVAVAVEFAQQWFAPRTVSQNDLIAESVGTVLGLALWTFGRRGVAALLEDFARGGRASLAAGSIAFGLAYLALALFPYDFVISAAELRWKLDSDLQGWLVAPACGGSVRCGARLVLDALAVAPLGLLAALLWPGVAAWRLFAVGVLAGLVIEPVQLLLASGTAQGASVLLRGVGLAAGGLAGGLLRRSGPRPLGRSIALAGPVLAVPYLGGLALVSGWFSAPALSVPAALARVAEIRWLPFYYHYFTTEAVALASTLAHLALYGAPGLWVWALGAGRARGRRSVGAGAGLAVGLAIGLAAAVEAGKLFFPPNHPDPTNLLVAATGALLVYGLALWLERVLTGREGTPGGLHPGWRGLDPAAPVGLTAGPTTGLPGTLPVLGLCPAPGPLREPPASPCGAPECVSGPAGAGETRDAARPRQSAPAAWPEPRHSLRPTGLALAALAALPLLAGILTFPIAWPALAAALGLYGALLWRWLAAWLLVLPALLPVLDLSPLTGRLPLDAFDLCVLTTLAVGLARTWGVRPAPWPNRLFPLALALLWGSWLVSASRGLGPLLDGPWPPPDGSHSPVEVWMVGKGMLWALLLVPLLRRLPAAGPGAVARLPGWGMAAGLGLVGLAVLWERHVHVGLWDFADVFRVTGPFASMHTGGAYIEAYIAFAFPFLAVTALGARGWALRLGAIVLAAVAAYAMAVTFSRGGWAGLATGLAVLVAVLAMRGGRGVRIGVLALVAAVALAAVPVLTGSFARERLAQSAKDLAFRVSHWQRALSLMGPGAGSVLLGEGFGQYPIAYLLLAEPERPPGTFAIVKDGDDPLLRLGSGETVFLDQRVGLRPGQTYRFSARVRRSAGAASLQVAVCEKALLYSFACARPTLEPALVGPEWRTVTAVLASGDLGRGGRWPHPPVKLSLHNAGPAGPVDVDDVSLKAADGRELIANGDFARGARRWLFVTDQDLAWHIHQLWVELYFAQGLLGVLALLALLAAAGRALWRPLVAGEPAALALGAGLVGISTVGLLGSVLDTAPLAMLLYLGALLPVVLFPGEPRRRGRRRGRGRSARSAATAEPPSGRPATA